MTQAEADLAVTLESPGDFGQPFTLTDPAGFESATQLYGNPADIGQTIDPETGLPIAGRHVSMSVRISTLTAAGYASPLPVGIADALLKPWRVTFVGTSTGSQRYKVASSMPDRKLGLVTLILEAWNEAP